MSYHTFGNGTPIVFIPPPVVGSIVFGRQVKQLSAQFKVILVELRGHGLSEPSNCEMTYPVIARDVCGVMDDLNIHQTVICGYSMGSSVVLEFARMFPDRILGGIPISCFSEATDARLRTEISTAVALAKVRAIKTLSFALSLANAGSLQSFQSMYRVGIRSNRADVQSMFEYALKFNCTNDLRNIKTPMCLIYGAKDRRMDKYASILEKSLPNRSIVRIPGARHQIPIKFYRELNHQITEFVSTL